MADWLDIVSFLVTVAVFAGVIYGVSYAIGQINEGVQSTKEALKEKGLDISDKGVSVKTSRRLNREDYVDATQRGFVKAMGASSFRRADGPSKPVISGSPQLHRADSEQRKTRITGSRAA